MIPRSTKPAKLNLLNLSFIRHTSSGALFFVVADKVAEFGRNGDVVEAEQNL
jgi:hypothetical protein